jgi:hypothetical protein
MCVAIRRRPASTNRFVHSRHARVLALPQAFFNCSNSSAGVFRSLLMLTVQSRSSTGTWAMGARSGRPWANTTAPAVIASANIAISLRT